MRRILVVVTEIYLQEKLVRARPEVAPLRFPAFSDKSASEFSFRLFLGLFSTLLDKMQATVRRRQRQYSTNNVKIFAEIAAGISTIKTYSILSWIVRPECPTRAKNLGLRKFRFWFSSWQNRFCSHFARNRLRCTLLYTAESMTKRQIFKAACGSLRILQNKHCKFLAVIF